MSDGTMQAKVITVSDGVFHGVREDRSGVALREAFEATGWTVVLNVTVADGIDSVAQAIRTCAEGFAGVVATTGGTGFGPRDLTPEGTLSVLERQAPGLAEAMRLVNAPLGRLSRGVAGTIGQCVVINTPGSPKGCVECLLAVIDVLPHAVSLMTGETTIH
jgi:molybdopterin adenylyltransferase